MDENERLEIVEFAPTRADLHFAIDAAIIKQLKLDDCEAFAVVEYAINIVEALENSNDVEALIVVAQLLSKYPDFLKECRSLPPETFQYFPSPFPINSIT